MDCREIKNQLSEYIDGALGAEAAERVARHLEACPDCMETYEGMSRVVGYMREMEPVREPADFLENVKTRLEEKPSPWAVVRRLFSPPAVRLPVGAAVAAAVLMLVLYLPGDKDIVVPTLEAPTEKRAPAATAPEPAEEGTTSDVRDAAEATATDKLEPGPAAKKLAQVPKQDAPESAPAREAPEPPSEPEPMLVDSYETKHEEEAVELTSELSTVESAPADVSPAPEKKAGEGLARKANVGRDESVHLIVASLGGSVVEPLYEDDPRLLRIAEQKAGRARAQSAADEDKLANMARAVELEDAKREADEEERPPVALLIEIPADQYEAFLKKISGLGEVIAEIPAETPTGKPTDQKTVIVRLIQE
jgi:negative regulator of sigma E activity